MKTVTSLSGGRTSSYMALHYPTDYNIFSLVRIEDRDCAPTDPSIIRYVEDKIQMEFIATAESDLTLYVLRQLEQDLGKEIVWVTGDTFEQVIKNHSNALPNRRMRFCTTDMKLTPIFWWCYLNIFECEDDVISMNIGYRADEPKRGATDDFKFVFSCNNFGQNRQNWLEIDWRDCNYPLRKDGITNLIVKSYFAKLSYKYLFPKYSNCTGCMNKAEDELQEQFILEPAKMAWFNSMEKETGNRFNISDTLENIFIKDLSNGQQNMFSHITCNCTD